MLWGGQMIGDSMMAKSATKARDVAGLQKSEPQIILYIYLTHRIHGAGISTHIWLIFMVS